LTGAAGEGPDVSNFAAAAPGQINAELLLRKNYRPKPADFTVIGISPNG
jgi:hypothetical protein